MRRAAAASSAGLTAEVRAIKPARIKDTARPFRLWDSVARRNVPHRCYSDSTRAHDGALRLVRWEKTGRTIEVYDVVAGRHLGTYKRGVNFIDIWTPKE